MKVIAKLSVLTSILILCSAASLSAQSKEKVSFNGTVLASETEGGGEFPKPPRWPMPLSPCLRSV